jgi:hypothetical protein
MKLGIFTQLQAKQSPFQLHYGSGKTKKALKAPF